MNDDGTGVPESQALDGTENPTTADQPTGSTATGSHAVTTNDAPDQASEEVFDKERALALIRKQRAELKASQQAQRELDELRRYREEAENAKLTEQQRLEKERDTLRQQMEAQSKTYQERINRYEAQVHAANLGIIDPDAAVKLLDWSAIERNDDGTPRDVAAALKDLVAEKPYLLAQATPGRSQPAGSATNPATRTTAATARVYTAAEIADRAFWNANKSDIILAMRENRITE